MSAKFSLTTTLISFALVSTITSSYVDDFQYYAHRVEEVDRHDHQRSVKNVVNYRLPNDTRPLEYEVTLQTWIHEPNFEFTGHVRVKVLAEEATNTVTLHYRRTDITSAVLYTEDGATDLSDVDGFQLDTEREFIEVTARQALIKGAIYLLDIRYNGMLREDNVGFYRSSYIDENGVKT
jgi:Peptidase M1 N-terminal domain